MQAHYALYLAVPLAILYIRRQMRKYHEHEVRFYAILRTKCTFNRIAGSKDIRRATRMSTSASNSEPETVGRGSTGADLPRRSRIAVDGALSVPFQANRKHRRAMLSWYNSF